MNPQAFACDELCGFAVGHNPPRLHPEDGINVAECQYQPTVFRLMYAASVLGSLLHLGLGLQLHWADTARDRLVVGEMSWAYFALGLCRFACPGIVN